MFSCGQTTRWRSLAHCILQRRAALECLSPAEFQQQVRTLRWQVRAAGPERSLLPEAYAIGIEASRRTLKLVHFPVQVMGAIAIFEGRIAEMQTGEGKTLTATLPVFFRALAGQGAHVFTANSYLAQRDAEIMRPLYCLLGLTVGCVHADMSDDERRAAYACDITYGTATEVGFDFLRDRLKTGSQHCSPERQSLFGVNSAGDQPVQRGHYFAMIDEADSILIDEARTPLIIGVMEKNREAMVCLYRWCAATVADLSFPRDFQLNVQTRQVSLTDAGCRQIHLMPKPVLLDSIDTETLFLQMERALTAKLIFEKNRDYVLKDEEVVIVDEGTGRTMDGRKWRAGLHQSIEAKERVPITDITQVAARMTVQSLCRQYRHLAGMTGTAIPSRTELRRAFGLQVSIIPTHRPCQRVGWPARIFLSKAHKHAAIVQSLQPLMEQQRSILIGTPSVDASEAMSRCLQESGIAHVVLNARFAAEEAAIIADAGQPGRVTIATNMAGRGTDIHLHESVRARGGLHVIATELHTSRRIDRQLIGRAARQGDPGSYQLFLSLDDELFQQLPLTQRTRLRRQARPDDNGELEARWVQVCQRLQRSLERLHENQRRQLLKHEHQQQQRFRRSGLDPFLEIADE